MIDFMVVPHERDETPVEFVGPFTIGECYAVATDENERVPTFDELQELFSAASRAKTRSTWVMADALSMGIRYLNDEVWNLYFEGLELSFLYNLKWISSSWPPELRIPGVSISYHQELTSRMRQAIEQKDVQRINDLRQWLIDARDLPMTRAEMVKDVASNSRPPSLRFESDLSVFEPLELVVQPPEYKYSEALAKARGLREWLRKNDTSPKRREDIDEVIEVLKQAVRIVKKYGE